MDIREHDPKVWEEKLVGKKIGDSHDQSTFAKEDLPKTHQVLYKHTPQTKDYRPERLNVHVDDDGVCNRVTVG